ncbi:MAG: T9SS type A sorting domain-containing protein [Aureispira sp.]|nr:T9SS type A sorting domain-containing protein [Aureispira sp.]
MKLMNLILLIVFLGTINLSTIIGQCGGAITASIAGKTDVACFGSTTGTATAMATGGNGGPYTYQWDAAALGQTAAMATGLQSGTYTVTVTDPSGPCQDVTSVYIDQPATAINVTANITSNYNGAEVSCNGASDGEANAIASGGTPNYTYLWSVGSQATVTGLQAGTYTVTATDANGCTDVATITVTEPSAVTASIASQVSVACHGDSTGQTTATGTGGTGFFSFAWPNGQVTATATALHVGGYTVTVTDANNCQSIAPVVITQPATAVSASAIQTGAISSNGATDGAATASGSGGTVITGYAYQWDTGAGNQTSAIATGLAAGVHTVTMIDDNGCTDIASVTMTQPSAVTATITSQSDAFCNGDATGQATVAGSGGSGSPYSFQWDASTGNQIMATATGLAAGTYSVTVTDASGLDFGTTIVVITEPTTAVSAFASIDNEPSCNGAADGQATVVGSGGTVTLDYGYSWADGQVTAIATGLAAGGHTVTVTDDNGCIATASVTLTEPSALTLTMDSTEVSCNGVADGTAAVTTSGGTVAVGYTYLWSDPLAQTTATAIGLASGVYEVTVTDYNGCHETGMVSLTEPSAITVSLVSTTNVTCKGGSDGDLTVSAIGGTVSSAHMYLWSNGATTPTNVNLLEGIYSVTVIDDNGCHDTISATVGVDNDAYINKPSFTGLSTGVVQIYSGDVYLLDGYSSDLANMTYSWTPAASLSCASCINPMANPAQTTTYHFTATHNTASCVFEDSITVEVYNYTKPDTLYLALEPDSSEYTTAGPLLSFVYTNPLPAHSYYAVNSLSGTVDLLPAITAGGFGYTAGSAPNVIDTFGIVYCSGLCDTTIVIAVTGTCVWPGDANDDQVANNVDLLPIGLHYGASGYVRPNASLSYACEPNRDWGVAMSGQPSTDIKHVDTDGNAVINDDDTLAISQNWGQVHLRGGTSWPGGAPIFVDTMVANPGDTLHLPVMLGDLANVVNSAYGLAFTVKYDSTNIKPGSVSMTFDNSWMGNGLNTISIQKDFHALGRIEAALTRKDQTGITGNGQIGTLHLTIKDVVLPNRNWGAAVRLDFEVTDVTLINNLGSLLPVDPQLTQVLVSDPTTGLVGVNKQKQTIRIVPNPASYHLDISTTDDFIEKAMLYTLEGRLVSQYIGAKEQMSIDLQNLPNGMYIIAVQTNKGVYNQQLIIQK